MKQKLINLRNELARIKQSFSPRIIGEVNNEFVKLAKIEGDKVPWHSHEGEDELFYIISGSLNMEIRDQEGIIMKAGDMIIVPRGTEHRVSSKEECCILLVEGKTTKHTGDQITEITKSIEEQYGPGNK